MRNKPWSEAFLLPKNFNLQLQQSVLKLGGVGLHQISLCTPSTISSSLTHKQLLLGIRRCAIHKHTNAHSVIRLTS